MSRGGARPNSGRKSWKQEFDAACMLGTAAGILIDSMNKNDIDLTDVEKERRRIAIEVFKKLAPSNINLGGQKDNPLTMLIDQLHSKAEDYARNRISEGARIN